MANMFKIFTGLLPVEPVQVGTVDWSDGDYHQVILLGGGIVRVKGKAQPNDRVFIKGDMIQSIAPALTLETIEV
jgi:hypothetical protein